MCFPCGKKCLLVFGFLVILYGYRLYKPLPEGISSPWASTKFIALLDILDDVAMAGSTLGFRTKLNITRKLLEFSGATLYTKLSEELKISDSYFDGVRVRIYEPIQKGMDSPAIIFYHGGGFAMCNIEVHDSLLRFMAKEMNIFMVSVDFRLAPENPYPSPLEDCLKATQYFINHSNEYGVDPKRVAVMGDSSGGTLAAAVSLKMLRQKEMQPKLQVLIYPMLQAFDMNLPSIVTNSGKLYGTQNQIALSIVRYAGIDEKYSPAIADNNHTSPEMRKEFGQLIDVALLPERYRKDYNPTPDSHGDVGLKTLLKGIITDEFFMPLMAKNLNDLPETYMVTAEYDILRDEGLIFAKRLEMAGVTVHLKHYSNAFHGVFNMIEEPMIIDVGVQMVSELMDYLKQNL